MATLNLNEKKIPSAENLRLIAQLCISLANKQSSLEDRCIAPWKSGEVYQKDISYVSYNNYLYFCTVSNSDTDFVESHWAKLSDTISELTKSDIEALVNLTPEQITNLQSLIDDTSISTTHTNSSSHIYMAIQDAITECKDDTLKQIAKKVSGSYKIANTTADIVSADYIYLLSNGSNYDLYVLVDGTATKVGDTNIDLSEYVKTTDLADYMKTSDADGKFATITTVDKKADKSEIPTTVAELTDSADYAKTADVDAITTKLSKLDNTSADKDKVLTANGDNTTSWKVAKGGHDMLTSVSDVENNTTANTYVVDALVVKQYSNRKTDCIVSTLVANNDVIEIQHDLLKDDTATYEFMFEPTTNASGEFEVLTLAKYTLDTTNGVLHLYVTNAPTVDTRIRIDITHYRA